MFMYILSNFLLTTNFDLKEVFHRESRKMIDMGILKKENTKKTKKAIQIYSSLLEHEIYLS